MLIRRLALLVLASTVAACTVSPIPSSPPPSSGNGVEKEELRVRDVVDRHFGRLYGDAITAPEVDVSSLDITGDVAAVKVVQTYPAEVRVEYVHLALAGGEWRIVNKVSTHWTR